VKTEICVSLEFVICRSRHSPVQKNLLLQETPVSKLETAVSFYSLTPQKLTKIKGFFLARYFHCVN